MTASTQIKLTATGLARFAADLKNAVQKVHRGIKHHRSVKGKRMLESLADSLEADLREAA